jgi:diaphanous 1
MASHPLIIPIQLVNGALQFVELPSEEGTVEDVVGRLAGLEEVRKDILGDLSDKGWALQRIKEERSGRPWEEDELVRLGDGELLRLDHDQCSP